MNALHDFSVRKQVLITLAVLSAMTGTAAQDHSDPILFNGHYYAVNKDCKTWLDADDWAESLTFRDPETGYMLAGHLVTITSQEENDFVHRNFVSVPWSHAWIGGYRASDAGGLADNWVWVTGEPWEYTNWWEDQPERYDEDRLSMMNFFLPGTWHDYGDHLYECGYRFNVVEFEPPLYTCTGFEPPAHKGRLTVSNQRTVPLKLQIQSRKGKTVTADLISKPPELVITFSPADGAQSAETAAIPLNFKSGKWHTNLNTGDCCREDGTYLITVRSGNEAEYRLRDPCTLVLVMGKHPPGLGNYKLDGRKGK